MINVMNKLPCRGLREARDQAITEKQQHKLAETEILKRYDDLLHEFVKN